MAETKRWLGLSTRSELAAANNLGTVVSKNGLKKLRKPELELYDSYYESRQYAHLVPWDQTQASDNSYVPVRKRQPRLQFSYAKVLCSRLATKLVGSRTFPDMKIELDPDTEQYLKLVIKSSGLKNHVLEPTRRALAAGSALLRFSIVNGQWKMQHFLAKWCFPEFDPNGNLEFVKIQYVYDDEADRDKLNKPKKKWFRMDLGKFKDVLYDNPEYRDDVNDPAFQVVAEAQHDLGFVQAEWFKTSEIPNSVDGYSVICDITDFIDELNYSLSQSSTAIQYNQDPQLTIKGMDQDEMDALIRSSMKAWNLGREGDASFIEAGMAGVQAAAEFRDKIRLNVQDLTRVVLLDPEKIVGNAQSAKAMEVLHGPMVELIEELRPQWEKHLNALVLKMAMANLMMDAKGGQAPIPIPPGYRPQSIDITFAWPEIFQPTMQDIQTKVSIATQVASANIISRETMTRWLSKEFGVENIDEELAKIAAQPVINPFGGF